MKPWRSSRYGPLALLLGVLVVLLTAAVVVEHSPDLGRVRIPHAFDTWTERAPIFDPPPGQYDRSLWVTLQPTHPRADVVFASGGTVPTVTVGTRYRQPIFLDADHPALTVLSAVSVVDGRVGDVGHAAYLVGVENRLPVLSLTVDPADLWDAERGILVHPWERGREWERPAVGFYFEPGGAVGFQAAAGMRTHRIYPFDADKPSFRLYFRESYGAVALTYPIFDPQTSVGAVASPPRYNQLLLQAGDQRTTWALAQDALIAETADALGLRVAPRRFVWLFINGESWGLYHLAERIDRFFLEKAYGAQQVDVVQDGREREGTDEAWDALIDWVEDADLTDPDHYAYLQSQIDLADFTDFAVLQLTFGVTGEAWFAARPRGGRWFWLYGGETPAFASRIDAPIYHAWRAPTDFAVLLRQLLDNPAYRARFVERAAVLLETELAPDALEPRVDALARALSHEIGYEEARWPRSVTWEAEIDYLRRFARRRSAVVRSQIAASLE